MHSPDGGIGIRTALRSQVLRVRVPLGAPLDSVWRSLVAHLHGVQGVASSNLATETNDN